MIKFQCKNCKNWFDEVIIPLGSTDELCFKCSEAKCRQNAHLIKEGLLTFTPRPAEIKREEEKDNE